MSSVIEDMILGSTDSAKQTENRQITFIQLAQIIIQLISKMQAEQNALAEIMADKWAELMAHAAALQASKESEEQFLRLLAEMHKRLIKYLAQLASEQQKRVAPLLKLIFMLQLIHELSALKIQFRAVLALMQNVATAASAIISEVTHYLDAPTLEPSKITKEEIEAKQAKVEDVLANVSEQYELALKYRAQFIHYQNALQALQPLDKSFTNTYTMPTVTEELKDLDTTIETFTTQKSVLTTIDSTLQSLLKDPKNAMMLKSSESSSVLGKTSLAFIMKPAPTSGAKSKEDDEKMKMSPFKLPNPTPLVRH